MTSEKHLLIIGTVWPEPNSSAAGSRMLQLIDLFLEQGFTLSFASPTLKSDYAFDLGKKGIRTYEIHVNNSDFDVWIKELQPTHVMFDRFMMEEQFGWRVAEQCPEAFRILDTEDLHCLRKVRQDCVKKNIPFSLENLKASEITKREIASILRSDLSILIASYEYKLLEEKFQIPISKLCYLPLLIEEVEIGKVYEERLHFMTIGSFRHEPNVDSVLFLKQEIWPEIRKQLPDAELHIYGSYPKQKVSQLHNPRQGFLVKGWAEDALEVIGKSRVMLAPLRFGAGQKGKFIDALKCGTPSITTSIGAESMGDKDSWSGCIANSKEELIKSAVELYTNKEFWESKQKKGVSLINTSFSKSVYQPQFKLRIEGLEKNKQPFYIELLNYHSSRNSRFMSKWIEEKNKK